jgi:hypothetical protein
MLSGSAHPMSLRNYFGQRPRVIDRVGLGTLAQILGRWVDDRAADIHRERVDGGRADIDVGLGRIQDVRPGREDRRSEDRDALVRLGDARDGSNFLAATSTRPVFGLVKSLRKVRASGQAPAPAPR